MQKVPKRLTQSSFPHPIPFFTQKPDIYFFLSVCSLSTFFTIFCSSMRKARTTRSWTQLAHREPPYDRLTDFWGFEIWEYSRGRRAGTYTCRVSYCAQLVLEERGIGLDSRCRQSRIAQQHRRQNKLAMRRRCVLHVQNFADPSSRP